MRLNNLSYIDQSYFEKESNKFRANCWILVAHKNELQNSNDFITFDYLGVKVFVQNFNGIIKAFQNICLHRFNTIHVEPCGNRVSSCLYHNWTYNKDGKVVGLSCRNSFDKAEVKELALDEFQVEFCGDFVFVKLEKDNEETLNSYLGNIFEPLSNISIHFGDKNTDYKIPHNANWKLLIENVLECYHCSSIHENSFAKMGYGFGSPTEFDFYDAHSWCMFPKATDVKENKIIEKTLEDRTFKSEGYLHFYIYPNAFVSTVEGKGFYLGFLLPESPSKSNLRVRYFAPKLKSEISESKRNILDFINNSSLDSLDLVLNEDKKIVENIQPNLNSVKELSPIFGDEEFRIINFYRYLSNTK